MASRALWGEDASKSRKGALMIDVIEEAAGA